MTIGGRTTGAVLLLAATPAFAAEQGGPIALEPSSKWNVNYANDFCRLSRTFGTGKDEIALFLDRYSPGDSFRMTLIGDAVDAARRGGTAKMRFGPTFPEQEGEFASGFWREKIPAWIFVSSARIRPWTEEEKLGFDRDHELYGTGETLKRRSITEAEEAMVTEVQFGKPLRKPLVLRTGSMKPAFAALRACTDELLTHWGIDVARHKDRAEPPKPASSPGRWISWEDYPSAMIQKGQQGIVHFRLTVGEDGRPSACHIQQSTRPQGFDDAVCKAMMRRARFEPARDKDGKPLVSYYLNTVRFSMP